MIDFNLKTSDVLRQPYDAPRSAEELARLEKAATTVVLTLGKMAEDLRVQAYLARKAVRRIGRWK